MINYVNIDAPSSPYSIPHPDWVKNYGSVSFVGTSLTNQWGESAEVLIDSAGSSIYKASGRSGSFSGTLVAYFHTIS